MVATINLKKNRQFMRQDQHAASIIIWILEREKCVFRQNIGKKIKKNKKNPKFRKSKFDMLIKICRILLTSVTCTTFIDTVLLIMIQLLPGLPQELTLTLGCMKLKLFLKGSHFVIIFMFGRKALFSL